MKKIGYIIGALLALAAATSAENANLGVTAGTFLKIPQNARMISMAEAFTAVCDDQNAIYGNAGGLANVQRLSFGMSHVDWIDSIKYESLSAVHPIYFNKEPGQRKAQHSLGYSINYLHMDPIEAANRDWGNIEGAYTVYSLYALVGYGINFGDWNIGASMKYVHEQYGGTGQTAFAFDIGALWTRKLKDYALFGQTFTDRPVHVGIKLANLGTKVSGTAGESPFYKALSLGFSGEFFPAFTFAFDLTKNFDNALRVNIGAEYWFRDFIAVRLGYRLFGIDVDGFTAGVGIRKNFAGKLVQLDIAIAPEGVFKNTVYVSLGIRFPGKSRAADATLWYYQGIQRFVEADYEGAIECWQKCLEIDPNHELARQKIAEAQNLIRLREIENQVEVRPK